MRFDLKRCVASVAIVAIAVAIGLVQFRLEAQGQTKSDSQSAKAVTAPYPCTCEWDIDETGQWVMTRPCMDGTDPCPQGYCPFPGPGSSSGSTLKTKALPIVTECNVSNVPGSTFST